MWDLPGNLLLQRAWYWGWRMSGEGQWSGWDSLIFYHKQIRACVCSSAVSVRWRWINNPVVSCASDKPDQTDAVLNLALFPLLLWLLFFLGMSPGGLDYSLIALKLKTKQFQKALWLGVCNFRLQPSLALGLRFADYANQPAEAVP